MLSIGKLLETLVEIDSEIREPTLSGVSKLQIMSAL
jgi:hypothetical protein